MDNISELCRSYLPEVNLLDFLLDCPFLMELREYIDIYGSVPEFILHHEVIWPLPSDFVPRNIIGDDTAKSLKSEAGFKGQFKESEDDVESTE